MMFQEPAVGAGSGDCDLETVKNGLQKIPQTDTLSKQCGRTSALSLPSPILSGNYIFL